MARKIAFRMSIFQMEFFTSGENKIACAIETQQIEHV
jgi:hypothetical protein